MRNTIPVDEARLNLVHEGMSYDQYAGLDAINAHGLMNILESPAHYKYRLSAPSDPSPAMKTGIQVDMALFEPAEFAKRYYVKGQSEAPADAEPITPAQLAKVQEIVAAVRANPMASELLASGTPQPTVIWQDKFHGVTCKARLDFISKLGGRKVAVDLKTTANSDPHFFAKKIADYRYDLQAAHYLEAGRVTRKFDADLFMFIAVETKAPYTCYVYRAGESVISRGVLWRDHAMQIYTACLRQNDWPGQPPYQTIEMPYWAKPPEEEQSDLSPLEAPPPPPDDVLEG